MVKFSIYLNRRDFVMWGTFSGEVILSNYYCISSEIVYTFCGEGVLSNCFVPSEMGWTFRVGKSVKLSLYPF